MAIGIASWRGAGLTFTDGMCAGCAVRFRRQSNLPEMRVVGSVSSRFRLVPAAATLAVVATLLVAGRPLDDGLRPRTTAPETVLVPPPVDEAPAPRPSPPRATRRIAAVKTPSPSSDAAAASGRSTPAPGETAPDSAIAMASTDPLLELEAIRLVGLSEPEPEPRPERGRRFGLRSTFAALPPAGLTQQTP